MQGTVLWESCPPSIHPIHFPINIGNAECLLGAELGAELCAELLGKGGGPVPEMEEPTER